MSNLINVEKNILEDYNLLFIHIPKCGGRAIVNNFVRYHNSVRGGQVIESGEITGGPAHQPASLIYQNDRYRHLDNFVFVRNPYERIASNYFWQIRAVGEKYFYPLSSRHVGLNFKSFYDFVMHLPTLNISHEHESSQKGVLPYVFQPQTWWMNDKTVFVGKMENMHTDLNRLIGEQGISFPLFETSIENTHAHAMPAMNVKRKYFEVAYNQEMIDVINELYREDFQTFGYEVYDKTIKGEKTMYKTADQVSDDTTLVSMADVAAHVTDSMHMQQDAFLKALEDIKEQLLPHLQALYARVSALEEQIGHSED